MPLARNHAGAAAAVGLSRPKSVEVDMTVVAPEPGATVTFEDAQTRIRDRLARVEQTKHVVVADPCPRSQGNVHGRELREQHADLAQQRRTRPPRIGSAGRRRDPVEGHDRHG